MPMMPISMLFAAAMALVPLDAGQQARLAAWLNWAVAYRDCYAPAPYSLRIDEKWTARCIERRLRQQRAGPPEERAATAALIAATPRLIVLLNAPADQVGSGGHAQPVDPTEPPARH